MSLAFMIDAYAGQRRAAPSFENSLLKDGNDLSLFVTLFPIVVMLQGTVFVRTHPWRKCSETGLGTTGKRS